MGNKNAVDKTPAAFVFYYCFCTHSIHHNQKLNFMKPKSTLFCLLFALCTNINITAKAQAVNVQDSLALVDLYNSTNGPGWYNHDNWLTGPVKTWYGITVTGIRVTGIILRNNQLSGSIPSPLGNLVNLVGLDFYFNQLSDSIPSSLGNLVNLTYLILR